MNPYEWPVDVNSDSWRIAPNGNRVKLGYGVTLGDDVQLGYVVRVGYRPEWVGLCPADHDLICLRVRVRVEDVLFAGLPTMDAKLRVRKLEVLD
jgi:hypothetical protein